MVLFFHLVLRMKKQSLEQAASLRVLLVEHGWFKHWKMKSVYWNDLSNTL